MNIQAEVDENGVIKITDPNWLGKKVVLRSEEWSEQSVEQKTDWEAMKTIARKADQLDFPRRSHAEIICDLHELRG